MKIQKQVPLTEGPILKSLTGLAVPIMISSFLGTLYNITDMAWIGLLGSKAVAAVGVGGMYVWLSQGLASLARMGGQVYVAQSLGRREKEQAHRYAKTAVQLSIILGLAFAAVSLVFTNPLVGFFKLEDAKTIQDAKIYMQITCGLIVFSFINLTLTGVYTAQGDSKTPFLANFIGLLINLVLDPVLILGIGPFPRIEVAGAAIATVSAQFVVMLVMIIGVFRSKEENVLKGIRLLQPFSKEEFKNICKIGGPTALQGMMYCMISMVLTRMVSAFGAEAIATQRVGGQIESISWNTADGFAAALNAFVGQNYGAKKMERVQKGYRISFWTVAIWGALIMLAFIIFPKPIAGVFFHEPKALEIAVSYLVIIGFSEAFMCVELMTIGALSGLGKTKLCSIISITVTSMRIPLALLLSRTALGLNGIWWALTLTSVAKGIIFYLTFRYQMRENVKRQKN